MDRLIEKAVLKKPDSKLRTAKAKVTRITCTQVVGHPCTYVIMCVAEHNSKGDRTAFFSDSASSVPL